MGLVDQDLEHRVHGSSHHFSAWNDLGVHLVEDVLEVLTLRRKLTVKKVQELLHKNGCNECLQYLRINV